MYYDLNVSYIANQPELQRTLAFLAELGYDTVALDVSISGKEVPKQIPSPLPFETHARLHILRRCTLQLTDPSQNHRLSSLARGCDILALRPTTEKTLLQACQALECDLISLDLSTRFPFYFKHTMLSSALQRGIKFELCYAPGLLNTDGGSSRRNLISNATQLIRATRGRGLIISSEAKRALGCRGPADVVNMAVLWGLRQERGVEAICREARSVVVQAEMKRRSFRGVIDVVYGGEKPEKPVTEERNTKGAQLNAKRKAVAMDDHVGEETVSPKPMSKRQQKKEAKKARLDDVKAQGGKKSDSMEFPAPSKLMMISKLPSEGQVE